MNWSVYIKPTTDFLVELTNLKLLGFLHIFLIGFQLKCKSKRNSMLPSVSLLFHNKISPMKSPYTCKCKNNQIRSSTSPNQSIIKQIKSDYPKCKDEREEKKRNKYCQRSRYEAAASRLDSRSGCSKTSECRRCSSSSWARGFCKPP